MKNSVETKHGSDRRLTVDDWLEAALAFGANFPRGTIVSNHSRQKHAAALLADTREEIRSLGTGIVEYFDSSCPRYEYALALALEHAPGRVLDLGCSPGHLGMALLRCGFDVHGLDLNELWLQKYAPGWAEKLQVRHADIERERIPDNDASYDVVMFTEVLEHIAVTDPQVILGDIHRVLRIGGRLILSTPNVANVGNILALARGENIFWPPPKFYGSTDRHNREFTPSELCELLERSGFSTYELGYMNTWSNWHHVTGPEFHYLHGGGARASRLSAQPLFNNTTFAVATRTK